MATPSRSQWESLFDRAVAIIDQANREFKHVDDWSFDVKSLSTIRRLDPQVHGYTLNLNPDHPVGALNRNE